MNIWLPIIAFVIGTWAGFGVACLLIVSDKDVPQNKP